MIKPTEGVGFVVYGKRYYDGSVGRFTQQDPAFLAVGTPELGRITGRDQVAYLGDPQGMNSYSYVRNNPIVYVDPVGEFFDVFLDVGFTLYSSYKLGQALLSGDTQAIKSEATNLSLDLAGAAIPGVVGLGTAKRVANAADNLGDAGKALNNTGDVTNHIDRLPDDAIVCRGGVCDASNFTNGKGVTADPLTGKLDGVSVQSAPGQSVEALSEAIKNNQVGVTTVGKVRSLGGDVISSSANSGSFHSTLSGITADQAEQLFKPTRKNPYRINNN